MPQQLAEENQIPLNNLNNTNSALMLIFSSWLLFHAIEAKSIDT